MSSNLLETLKEHLSGDVVSNLATLLGESPENTDSALNTTLVTLLAALADQSGNTQSVEKLFSLISEGGHDGGVLSNLGALSLGSEETTKLLSQGANLLSSLFGDKVSGITELIASTEGIRKIASSSLLEFVLPIVLGLVGKTLKIQNIDTPSGLADLLGSQKDFLTGLIPAGFSSFLSGNSFAKAPSEAVATAEKAETLGDVGQKIEDVAEVALSKPKELAEGLGESASEIGSHIAHEGKEFSHNAMETIEEGAGEGKKFLPWILIAAALALMWGLLKSCSVPPETSTDATAPTTTEPAVAAPKPMPAPTTTAPPSTEPAAEAPAEPPKTEPPAPTVEQKSDSFEKTLSTGYAIKAAKDGFISKLIGFIEGNEAINKGLWFTMDGIQFDSNKAIIKAESEEQISHIAEVLKAYPKVKIKIGGYTDNTGNDSVNKKLSTDRAQAVEKAIVNKDIKTDRIDAEGYGSDHPVASNDTPEGRQQNRRIDVQVTEK